MCTCLQGPQGPDDSYPECVCNKVKNIPHKHAALIKAWADGAKIECRKRVGRTGFDWKPLNNPSWYPDAEYRIKPVPKPDTSLKVRLFQDQGHVGVFNRNTVVNACCVFDGETGTLKSVSMLD